MYEPTKEVKKAIVEADLKGVYGEIYHFTVLERVTKNAGDDTKGLREKLVRLEKIKDGFEAELKALEQ